VIVVRSPPNAGPAEARNVGAERARGDVLVFVDADMVVHPDAFRRIRAAYWADPGLTAVFGSYDDGPSDPGLVSAFRNLLHHHVHCSQPGPSRTFWSGLGAVRRDAFLKVGGFDSARYPLPSIEDVELGTRLAASGAWIDLDSRVRATHLKHWSLRGMVETDFRRRGVPWVAMLLRGSSSASALNLSSKHRVSAAGCVVGVLAFLLRRRRVALAALLTVLALNHSFYALLWRQQGPVRAVVGIGLHIVHHLTAVAAVPAGVFVHFRERRAAKPSGDAGLRVAG